MVKRTRSKMLPYKLTTRHKAISDFQKSLWQTVTQDSGDFVNTNATRHCTGEERWDFGNPRLSPHLRIPYGTFWMRRFEGGGEQPYTQAMLERRAERLRWEAEHAVERARLLKRQRILRFLKYGEIILKQEKNDGK